MSVQPRILVVYKKDAYQQYIQEQRDAHLVRLLRRRHPDALDMQRAHVVQRDALEAVVRALRRLPVRFDLAYRADLRMARAGYRLVVSVGGDGTFLQAARSIHRTPILGVNSDPQRSEAVFCAATRQTFPRLCRLALAGRLPELRLSRLGMRLNGRPLPHRALNDILIVHDDPATMSRYRLMLVPRQARDERPEPGRGTLGRRRELQKSSGLWVATAAGSSSAVLAAGGARLPWGAAKYQYRPRELYRGRLSHPRLTGGVLAGGSRLRVTWLMRRGSAFVDGPHVQIPLRFADELEVELSLDDPLRVLGLTKNNRPPA